MTCPWVSSLLADKTGQVRLEGETWEDKGWGGSQKCVCVGGGGGGGEGILVSLDTHM